MEPAILFRPVGLGELRLIHQSGMKAFPPRLPSQPIFYPVFELQYARKIAKEWNAKPGEIGFVTRFEVAQEGIDRYEIHTAGGQTHTELWVPAEELEEFNRHIINPIEVIEIYVGEGVNRNPNGHDEFTDFVNALWDEAETQMMDGVRDPEELFDAITSGEVLLPEFLEWLADYRFAQSRRTIKLLKKAVAAQKARNQLLAVARAATADRNPLEKD
jgi:hypothetical protein